MAVLAAVTCAPGVSAAAATRDLGAGDRRPNTGVPPTDLAFGSGDDSAGPLGDGAAKRAATPVRAHLPAGVTVTQASAGQGFSLWLTSDGRVLSAGANDSGQLGDGTNTPRNIPVWVALPRGARVTQVSAGRSQALALTADGHVLAWGRNSQGALGDGRVVDSNVPVRTMLPEGAIATHVYSGHLHSLALTSDGRVLAWGHNASGQLGDGTTTDRRVPVQVRLPAGATVTRVGAGRFHNLALTSDGHVLAWGQNSYGKLGDGTTAERHVPVQVRLPAGATVTQLAAGWDHSMVLTSRGRVLSWGRNQYGQLGDGTTTDRRTPGEVRLAKGATAVQISATNGGVAVGEHGHVQAWGLNTSGQLGDGSTTNRRTPVFMVLQGRKVTAIDVGSDHTLVLTEPRSTGTALTAAPVQAVPGHKVTLAATVTCNEARPKGTAAFLDGDRVIGTGRLATETGELGKVGTATFDTSGLRAGPHHIIARYQGDGTCPSSTSDSVTATITDHPRLPEPCVGKVKVNMAAEGSKVHVGQRVRYTIRVTDTCTRPNHDAEFTNDLSGVSGSGKFMAGSAQASSPHLTYRAPKLHWAGDLASGANATVTYSVLARKAGAMRNRVTWHCGAGEGHAARRDCSADNTITVIGQGKHH
ncbi:Ig-like domain repeat protein [Spirillospora sp. NPDC052269]